MRYLPKVPNNIKAIRLLFDLQYASKVRKLKKSICMTLDALISKILAYQ